MSPIKDLQIQMRELGRLRMGEKAAGKSFPKALLTWRITTPSRKLADAIAEKYAGNVTEWSNEKKPGKQWQVTTEADSLEVLVPPGDVGSYWMEMWSGDGCLRRCDRVTNTITGDPCACPKVDAQRRELAKKGKACKATTRLSVILKGIPEVGLWRMESHGENAAKEMQAIATICELATLQNRMVPAELRIEPRTSKKPGEATSHFVVPVLDIGVSLDSIMESLGMGDEAFPQLVAPARPLALPAQRPALPQDAGFKEEGVGETAVRPPVPPVPGPPPEIDSDDVVAEAEIVGDRGSGGADESGVVGPEPTGEGGAPTATPDESDWSAKTWLAEAKKRGIAQRALILQAREIAEQKGLDAVPSKAADLIDPAIAPELRVWLNLQGA